MFGKDLLIKKYPYMGFSQNIMEYFAIIGYQENFLSTLIDSFKKKKNPYYPTILSSITSNMDYGIVDNELIISQIYPDTPPIYQINKNDTQHAQQDYLNTSNVIYSFCFDTADGKSKLFYTCFGFKFYEKYQHKSEEYFLPKAFCIVSQYNFFTFFENVCKNIYTLLNKKEGNTIPVELLLYNIINFVPSPMNYNLNLDLFSFCLSSKDIEINQLSGYPYIDFDLKEIFNIIPLNFFIEVYIITLLEQAALFFSSNLELLNLLMYIMYLLNYPCNDSTYFWHIVSVSKNNLIEENKFVGKVFVSLLGVNTTYEDSIDSFCFGRYHYVVDIDNKKIFLKESLDLSMDEKEEVENLNNLQIYIQNIIKEKNVESFFLKNFILKLKKDLETILLKELEHNPKQIIKSSNIFKTSQSINSTNKKIQEIFYVFNLNIMMLFYQDNSLVNSFDKIKRVDSNLDSQMKRLNKLKLNDNTSTISDEESHFMEFFRGTVKYKIYFENFIQNFDTIDVFKIALLFSEEFLNIKIKDTKKKALSKLSLFEIIDALYYPAKKIIINITINNLFSLSLDFLTNYFEENKKKSSKLINLDKKIINKYIFLLNNNYEKEELIDIFPSIRIQEEQLIISFDKRYIINIIQNSFEENDLLSSRNYIYFAVIYIFCISASLHSYDNFLKYIESITKTLSQIQFFMRQFIFIIIQTFYKYLLIHKNTGYYSELGVSQIKMYFYLIISFLKQNDIIPNEEMMAILSKFFGKMIFQERKSLHKKTGKEIDSDIDFIKIENQNFYCFMKYCFNNKRYYKSSLMIKHALKEKNYCNIIIKINQKTLKPIIVVKIKEYIYNSDFFSPKKIYKMAEIVYRDFYEKNNLNFSKLNIKDVRDCITNLILYGKEMGDDVPIDLLINTLYLLRNFEEKYQDNKNKIDINIEDVNKEIDEKKFDDNEINTNTEEKGDKNNEDINIIEE